MAKHDQVDGDEDVQMKRFKVDKVKEQTRLQIWDIFEQWYVKILVNDKAVEVTTKYEETTRRGATAFEQPTTLTKQN